MARFRPTNVFAEYKKLLTILALLCLYIGCGKCEYDEKLSIDLLYVSALSNCEPEKLMAKDCKAATASVEKRGFVPFFASENFNTGYPMYMSLFRRDSQKEIIVSFSGTRNPKQLIDEFVKNVPTDYDIHPGKKVKVLKYFYEDYKNQFRNDLVQQLMSIFEDAKFDDYKVIFTGHSLGGAMAIHAAADLVLSDFLINRAAIVYTFGQPRVGNAEFYEQFIGKLNAFYRVVHDKDIVPHLPPCVPNLHHGCAKEGFLIPIFPYHAPTEIYYDKEMMSYKQCSNTEGEDKDCSDSLSKPSFGEHLTYFGVRVGEYHKQESEQVNENSINKLLKSQ
ncbi:unnamed protein product [Moneuplotes crassus]|uniref:Fungal lipase-type domain-containing protein n=1 Tax=Euplotes crassus TaxID=5936 RepID=A0AAD1XI87_EUPCR|nr:unnamed protein product [Moneuplotes crassus]